MPSTKQQVLREKFFKGMNYEGVRPHLLDETQWYRSFGMRHFSTRVSEVPRKVEMYPMVSNHSYPLSVLCNIPSGFENFGLLVGMTDQGLWRLSSTASTRILSSVQGSGVFFNTDQTVRRWGTCLHNNRLFYVNQLNSVGYTDGTLARAIANAPMGTYVDIFYDRVVVGRPIFQGVESPDRIQWSSLYDFTQWVAKSQNEADSFDCVEHQTSGDGFSGITGMRRLGNLLITYTPSAIYGSRYVGLPWVITTEAVFQDVGCGLPWALASVNRSHYFVDMRNKTFMEFDGMSLPKDIGRPIRRYFFDDLNTDLSLQGRTYAYVDQNFDEIHWVYVSVASSGPFDREVVFNYKDDVWWVGAVEDVWSFSSGTRRSLTIEELAGTVDALAGVADKLGVTSDVVPRVYGSANARLLREEVPGDTLATLINRPTPYLETGDMHYGDIENYKEVESMAIHSAFDAVAVDGVQLQRSSRHHVDDTVSYTTEGQLWTPALKEHRLSAPRISGRVMRFKFQPHQVAGSPVTTIKGVATSSVVMTVQIPRAAYPVVEYLFHIDPVVGVSGSPGMTGGGVLNIPTTSNRFVLLFVNYSVGGAVTSATLGGVSMTKHVEDNAGLGGLGTTAVFYALNPGTGNKTLVVSAASPTAYWRFVGVVMSNVNQVTPFTNPFAPSSSVNSWTFASTASKVIVSAFLEYIGDYEIASPSVPYVATTVSRNLHPDVSGVTASSLGTILGGTAPQDGWFPAFFGFHTHYGYVISS